MSNKTESEEERYRRTAGERAVSFIGYMAGLTLDEVNDQLRRDGDRAGNSPRLMVPGSFDTYRSYAKKHGLDAVNQTSWQQLWEHVTGPKPLGG